MSEIKFGVKGIGGFIKENKFFVPKYQRTYSWEDKHVTDLFEDIKTNINESEYFLGTLVFTQKNDELEIIDGQQRITTILLFFAAFKEIFKKNEKNTQSEDIHKKYLSDFARREEKNVPKLKLSDQDNQYYENYIVNEDRSFLPKKLSHEKIKYAFEKAISFAENELKYHQNDINRLHDFMEFIDDKLKVVTIIVPEDSNAYTIFETLNDRGLVLAQIDLVKNYLYSKSGSRLAEIQIHWNELISKLEAIEEPILLEYIKVFWMSEYGFIREINNKLYQAIKSEKKSPTDVNTFVTNLNKDLDFYLALINDNNSLWDNYPPECKEYIKTLNYLELKQFRPLALAVLKNFEKNEVRKILKFIVSWMVRNLIVGSGGGALEESFAKKAVEITKKRITTANQLREGLKELVPQDKEFSDKFRIATVSKETLARYYLRAIENYNNGKDKPELIVNSNPDCVNLEHILPKKPMNNYPLFSADEHSFFLKRIGNLTIMSTKLNNDQKSLAFVNKKRQYKVSKIKLTKNLASIKGDWSPECIEKRQSRLADSATKTWSLNFD
jgi:uncharacterized protein with ParB-like and HNH nuclease domain